MATYTTSLGLELITPGSQAGLWGNTTNNTFNLVDQAITGVTPISFASASGTTYTLTDYNGAVDEARSAVINITGTASGANNVVVPNKQKTYLVRNNTGQNVVFKTASPSATYTVEAGNSILIFCDGNNNVFTGIQSPSTGTLSVSGGGTGATTFGSGGFVKSSGSTNALTSSTTVDAATELSNSVPVANGGTGKNTLASGSLIIGNGTGSVGTLSGTASGQIATWNGSTWVASAASSGVSSVSGTGLTVSPTTGNVVVTLTANDIANLGMQASQTQTGYQKLQSGLIIQWGLAISSGTSYGNWIAYFPTVFPNGLLRAVSTCAGYQTIGIISIGHGNSTSSYLYGTAFSTADGVNWGITSGMTGSYIAIGY